MAMMLVPKMDKNPMSMIIKTGKLACRRVEPNIIISRFGTGMHVFWCMIVTEKSEVYEKKEVSEKFRRLSLQPYLTAPTNCRDLQWQGRGCPAHKSLQILFTVACGLQLVFQQLH